MKTSNEIRNEFIRFFRDKQHTFVPSFSVVPKDDPTLLFTNAGMNQFKDVFLGIGSRPFNRAVNSQKCIRVSGKHNDLEEVGRDTYHHTFFEMLGNWSFGDYYKKEAIQWAWQLLTDIWKLPKDKLWATVFKDDEEAADLWRAITDIPAEKILKFGTKYNFWEMGETGPCGPCSEIHFDLGKRFCNRKKSDKHICQVNGDCGRFIELWNLVFIQYNRDEQGNLNPLPATHVDTGMGFERIVAVLQGVSSNYETDLFTPILQKIGRLTNLAYSRVTDEQKVAFRVISDHIRMLLFSISDGALPSNEGRGYVLRRILRRAARFGRKINLHEPFLFKLIPTTIDIMKTAFPNIIDKQQHVSEVLKSEEENFNKTLDRGIDLFDELVLRLKNENKNTISGKEAFRLYDTYGFPFDLTQIMAEENHMVIDEKGFKREMELQRDRARSTGKFALRSENKKNWKIINKCPTDSNFIGYDKLDSKTRICKYAEDNSTYYIVLADTPFYAESGGQVADKGILIIQDQELMVVDVKKQAEEIIHICEGAPNIKILPSDIIAKVNPAHRLPIMYNHTATHLLHATLRKVLGNHVQQAGSLVEPERLRFDFTHFKKISQEELNRIEQIVNEQIRLNTKLEISYSDFEAAQKMGAMALFGEKYEDRVRVINIKGFSLELCGGTHVKCTGEIGAFLITQESSIASGIRRIEAITGPEFINYAQNNRQILTQISQQYNIPVSDIPERIKLLNSQMKELEKEIQKIKSTSITEKIDEIIEDTEKIGSIGLAVRIFLDTDLNLLKKVGDLFRERTNHSIILLINKTADKLHFVCAVTDDLIKNYNLKAGELVREVSKITGGGGGGRAHLATAGGKDHSKIPDAIDYLKQKIKTIS